jgi:hypothetical protein
MIRKGSIQGLQANNIATRRLRPASHKLILRARLHRTRKHAYNVANHISCASSGQQRPPQMACTLLAGVAGRRTTRGQRSLSMCSSGAGSVYAAPLGLPALCTHVDELVLGDRRRRGASIAAPHVADRKTCSSCHHDLLISHFSVNKHSADGHRASCKSCNAERTAQRTPHEPAAVAEQQCSSCGETLPAGEFNKNKLSRTGRLRTCRTCCKNARPQQPRQQPAVPRPAQLLCTMCKQYKDVAHFNVKRNNAFGRSEKCKSCRAADNRRKCRALAAQRLCSSTPWAP